MYPLPPIVSDSVLINAADLRAEIARLAPWHHDFELAPGIRTGDAEPSGTDTSTKDLGEVSLIRPMDVLRWTIADVYPEGLAGRSLLDCACNGGGYVFAARALGGGRLFGCDVREHWIRQAQFAARHLPSDNIELRTLDLMTLPQQQLEPFDVTLFMGIFYHLADPLAGLRIAADHTNELLVVNTATLPGRGDSLVAIREGTKEVMSGVHGLAWLPTGSKVLHEILEWCGFPHMRVQYEAPAGAHGRGRMQVVAAKDERVFENYDRAHPRPTRRTRVNAIRRWFQRRRT